MRLPDIQNDFVNWYSVPYCQISEDDRKKYQLEKGDICIARTGASTGTNYTVKDDVDAVFASYLIRYKIDKAVADPFYIGFLLKSPKWREHVMSIIGGSAQPGANAKQFARFEFPLPPFSEQRAIAKILSDLDEKIELNHRMNKTLEAIAQAIFKRWFVDFKFSDEKGNPYKDSGGRMINSELGEIPMGWAVKNIEDIVIVKGGATPSTKESKFWEGGDIFWCTPKDLSQLASPVLLDTERKITKTGLQSISSGLLEKGTLLLSSRAPIGYLAISEIPVSINQGFIAMLCDKRVSNYFMYFWTKQNLVRIKNMANGSTFQEINKTNFRKIKIIVPLESALKEFDHISAGLWGAIVTNEKQSRELIQIRDSLLPKLMSGKIRAKS